MPAGIWFWIVYVILILFCGVLYWPFPEPMRRHAGVSFVILVLIGLLGWGIFGPPIR